MEQRIHLQTETFDTKVEEIVMQLSGFIGIKSKPDGIEYFKAKYGNRLAPLLRALVSGQRRSYQLQREYSDELITFHTDRYAHGVGWSYERARPQHQFSKEEKKVKEEEARRTAQKILPAWVQAAVNSLVAFVSHLVALCEGLADAPIKIGTGQKRMVKRIQPHITYLTHESEKITHPRIAIMHPQRTEADMVGEMRRELINLPRFTAWCKIVKEVAGIQQVVKYKLYPDAPENVEDEAGSADWKRAYIVERMHDESLGYYRKRETVEQEIAVRRATLKAREPKQKGQTTLDEDEE